jgi:hypothetical protein
VAFRKVSQGTTCQLVVVPALLVLVGYLVLRLSGGAWWGIGLWILTAPLVYLLVDMVTAGEVRRVIDGGTKGQRPAAPGKRGARRDAPPPPPPHRWESARTVSRGVEILRRGRRYDRRRA